MLYLSYFTIILAIVCFDQITKYLVSVNLDLHSKIVIIKDFFSLYYTHNTGVAFSMLEGKTDIFIILSSIAIFIFIYLLIKEKKLIYKICYLMWIGGALGNLIDRIRFQYVIDFLSFTFFGWNFAIFNIADCFITVACFIMMIAIFVESKHAKN